MSILMTVLRTRQMSSLTFLDVATPEAWNDRCNELFGWVQSGVLKVSPPTTFPLSKVAEAHEALSSRKTTGKLVLIP